LIEATILIDVFGGSDLEVKCVAKGAKLQLDRVTFHGVTDKQFQAIVDAIEMYLIRKRQRDLAARTAAPAIEEPQK
jgi:hypothetical protein